MNEQQMNKNTVQMLTDMSLTGNQYVFLVIVYHNDASLLRDHKLAIAPLPLIRLEELKDLQQRKFITKGEDGWKAGENLVDMMDNKDVYELYNEFFNSYPSFTTIGIKQAPLKIVDQKKMGIMYGDLMTRESHQDMMDDIEYGIENNLLVMKIDKYLSSEFYKEVRKLRTESNTPQYVAKDF